MSEIYPEGSPQRPLRILEEVVDLNRQYPGSGPVRYCSSSGEGRCVLCLNPRAFTMMIKPPHNHNIGNFPNGLEILGYTHEAIFLIPWITIDLCQECCNRQNTLVRCDFCQHNLNTREVYFIGHNSNRAYLYCQNCQERNILIEPVEDEHIQCYNFDSDETALEIWDQITKTELSPDNHLISRMTLVTRETA